MDRPALNVLSLCSGVGGLDLGIRLACPAARVVAYVEREAYACEVLAERMAEGRLDPAPVWSDLARFDGLPWRGVVDLVAGGFPCTDLSNAGKRAGLDGEHSSLWWEFVRVFRDVGPSLVFVENVPPLVVRGLDRVLGSLAELGFDAEWGVFSAAEVGAPHLRERFFMLANAEPAERRSLDVGGGRSREGEDFERQASGRSRERREVLADADCVRRRQGQREPSSPERLADADDRGSPVADASGERRDGGGLHERHEVGHLATKSRECGSGLASHAWPPGPDDHEAWAQWQGPQPCIRRGNHGLADRTHGDNRVDRLRVCGNGVVPHTAALAFRELSARLGLDLG